MNEYVYIACIAPLFFTVAGARAEMLMTVLFKSYRDDTAAYDLNRTIINISACAIPQTPTDSDRYTQRINVYSLCALYRMKYVIVMRALLPSYFCYLAHSYSI